MDQELKTNIKQPTCNDADLHALLDQVQRVRHQLGGELPIQNSLIALDILNNVALNHVKEQPLPVKSLMGALPHSPAGLRHHYARLIDDGWIKTEPDGEDGRVRLVKPSDRLINAYRNIFASCLAGS